MDRVDEVFRDPSVVRASKFGGWMAVVVILGTIFLSVVTPLADYLWFLHDVQHPEVFNLAYTSRSLLFLVAFVPTWILFQLSLSQAFKTSLVYLRTPESMGGVLVSNVIGWVTTRGGSLVRFASPVLAALIAGGFSNEWNTWLIANHGQSFGIKDPTYGLDLGFYVFTLPWCKVVTDYVFTLFLLNSALTIGLYVGLQAMAALARIELSRPHIRLHIALLATGTLLAFAAQNWLSTYDIGFIDSGQFLGAGYAATQGVAAQRVFAVLCATGAGLVLFAWKAGSPNRLLLQVASGLGIFYIVGVGLYPNFVQRFIVDPNRLSTEAPYAAKAIQMTRIAYGLDQVRVQETDVHPSPSAEELKASSSTLDNMRLWDPEIVRQSFEGLQGIRSYYQFNDVDVDRYPIAGKQTMMMLSPRDVNLNGLDGAAQNWTNQRLRFTHGYGVAAVQVNAATPEGHPDFLAQGIPQMSPPELQIAEPRVYFSDFRDSGGNPKDEYAVVRSGEPEIDYQLDQSTATHSWKGDRGIPIGSLGSRLLYALALGEGNLVFSPKISGESRLLLHRNVLERASKLLPFLKFDQDPYLVVLKGRLIWILDGYTYTDQIPYAARTSDDGGGLNYIRNSVKVTVDAYTGVIQAYAVEPNEPILKAYRSIYTNLIKEASTLPAGLRDHFRFPEDLFAVQSFQLCQYHLTDPGVFLSNTDAWQIPAERGLNGSSAQIRPYFVQMKLPASKAAEFLLIRPFTANGKPTMSGWLAAHCDPQSYGQLDLYRFTNQTPIAGPQLMETNFNSTPAISNINRQYQNGQSDILVGNLLVIPIGQSVMYVEPLYLRSRTPGITGVPRLFRVVLALNDKVVVGETFRQALDELFGEGSTVAPESSPAIAAPSGKEKPKPTVQEALGLLDKADSALRNGDFAAYGALQKQARAELKALLAPNASH